MVVIGWGCIGKTFLKNDYLKNRGYTCIAAFDSDADNLEKDLSAEIPFYSMDGLGHFLSEYAVDVAIIAVPPDEAQQVADEISPHVRAILNFSPVRIKVPDHITVQYVDFSVLLDSLVYNMNSKQKGSRDSVGRRPQKWTHHHSWPVTANA